MTSRLIRSSLRRIALTGAAGAAVVALAACGNQTVGVGAAPTPSISAVPTSTASADKPVKLSEAPQV